MPMSAFGPPDDIDALCVVEVHKHPDQVNSIFKQNH